MDRVEMLIVQLTKSEFGITRAEAARQLGLTKDKRAVPFLLEALKDVYVSQTAAYALGKIGDASAVPALLGMLEDKSHRGAHLEVAEALGEIRDSSAVPALIKVIKYDASVRLRGIAVDALRMIGSASAVAALVETFSYRNKLLLWPRDGGYRNLWEAASMQILMLVEECKTIEGLEEIEKGIDKGSAALRKKYKDKGRLTDVQIQLAKLTSKIAERKDELTPKRDLLLDDKPKPPKRGKGVYQTTRMTRNG